jgi:hypothetical protein
MSASEQKQRPLALRQRRPSSVESLLVTARLT